MLHIRYYLICKEKSDDVWYTGGPHRDNFVLSKKKIRHILQDTLKKKYNIKGALSPSLTWHIRTECCSKRSQKMERSRPCSIETQMDIGQHK